ncbi:MAG TPA: DUF4446 family protein [Candidatus Limnocylindria bacterium]|nr:DUF4446 family protein [Candidatus Limnocylindria bacterium]
MQRDLERTGQPAVQRVGVVRFNPVTDTGGDQSFAIALLDALAETVDLLEVGRDRVEPHALAVGEQAPQPAPQHGLRPVEERDRDRERDDGDDERDERELDRARVLEHARTVA